jgi:cytochrome c553
LTGNIARFSRTETPWFLDIFGATDHKSASQLGSPGGLVERPRTPMSRTTSILSFALALAAFAGCYTGPNGDLSPPTAGPASSTDGTHPSAGEEGASPEGGAPAAAEGLPCDVAKVLATSCTSCHGLRPKAGAPSSLVTYDDLVAKSDSDPGRTVADVSLERMKSTTEPMPPEGAPAASDIAILETWIKAGLPKGSCATKSATADGGGPGAAPPGDGGAAPKDGGSAPAPTVCTSGTSWVTGTPPSTLMLPGKACIACHATNPGPEYSIAGTVYPTLHEPDACNGIGGGSLTVVIVDATGKSHTMPVNAAGNFTRVTGIPMPYKAMIVDGIKTREMKTPQTDGDCNGCHTEQGNRSPGRIMAP